MTDRIKQLVESIIEDADTDEHVSVGDILVLEDDGTEMYVMEINDDELVVEAEYNGKKVELNKPSSNSGGDSKFKVYVKGCGKDKDRVKKVTFGAGGMKIKRSDPERKKSFRARHKCSTAKDKCSARYWSCRSWSSNAPWVG